MFANRIKNYQSSKSNHRAGWFRLFTPTGKPISRWTERLHFAVWLVLARVLSEVSEGKFFRGGLNDKVVAGWKKFKKKTWFFVSNFQNKIKSFAIFFAIIRLDTKFKNTIISELYVWQSKKQIKFYLRKRHFVPMYSQTFLTRNSQTFNKELFSNCSTILSWI